MSQRHVGKTSRTARSNELEATTLALDPSVIRQQFDKLRLSRFFAGSDRLLDFLRYLVEETLGGRGFDLRESAIGNAIYKREPPYDPRIDSTVRVEARRLRKKLNDYFESEGRSDPVMITIPVGGYVPAFRQLPPSGIKPQEVDEEKGIFVKGQGAAMAILPFQALSHDPTLRQFAENLTDELIYVFSTEPGLRVLSARSPHEDRLRPSSSIAVELGVDVVLQGTVKQYNDLIRVTVEASNATGFVTSSDRFDGPSANKAAFLEKIATTLLSRCRFAFNREIPPQHFQQVSSARNLRPST